MSLIGKWTTLFCVLLASAAGSVEAQVSSALQVPLETASGWGPVKPPARYTALRIQARSAAHPLVLARLFGDFASHPAMFSRVVEGVDILACDETSLRARYRTVFDSRPGGKTMVESQTAVKVSVLEDRVEFTWSSDAVRSSYVTAAQGRAMFVTRRSDAGTETLIDYVSAVRPKNAARGVLLETQKSVLANDAKYVIDRLTAAARHLRTDARDTLTASNMFKCSPGS